jgi:hypothetical protein
MFCFVSWLMRLCRRERHDIGRKGLPDYLTRWVLWGKRFAHKPRHNLFLHCFHRGDAELYCHDHPWPFWSLILWGGYWEITPDPHGIYAGSLQALIVDGVEYRRQWYGPLSLLRRPAEWRHRVEVPEGKRCWTLVWCGPKVRSWGFWCPNTGFLAWRQHQANQDAGGGGCPEA